jgi:hypothetical protein
MFHEALKLHWSRLPHLVATQDNSTVLKRVQERITFNSRHDQNASGDVARV